MPKDETINQDRIGFNEAVGTPDDIVWQARCAICGWQGEAGPLEQAEGQAAAHIKGTQVILCLLCDRYSTHPEDIRQRCGLLRQGRLLVQNCQLHQRLWKTGTFGAKPLVAQKGKLMNHETRQYQIRLMDQAEELLDIAAELVRIIDIEGDYSGLRALAARAKRVVVVVVEGEG